MKLQGAMTALVTPFLEDGSVDAATLRKLVRWQIDSGIDGLVPCGTTGEGATLAPEEHALVIRTVAEEAGRRVPVVAGCGTNDTRTTVAAAKRAAEAGADALLVVSPYYNKPNATGMVAHYRTVTEEVGLPVVPYNVPGRTGQNLGVELILRLAEIPGVVAVKEAAANLEQVADLIAGRPEGFSVLSGDDSLVLPSLALGIDGVVSVVSNEAPGPMARLVSAARRGDYEEARAIHYRLLGLMRVNFLESNPVPVKAAMAMLGFGREATRLPLGAPAPATREAVERALRDAGLLEAPR